jgi:aminoglycoside phosphotransferase family enzyme/predicted kinase
MGTKLIRQLKGMEPMAARENQHQSKIIKLMQTPHFYPHPVQSVTLRETHISIVFLTGDVVYKIKKPVDMDFLDFTNLESRLYFCEKEVELNRRLTRDVYLDVVAITLENDRYHLQGGGRPVEYAVKMRQLPDEAMMLKRLLNDKLNPTAIDSLARILSLFYRGARTDPDISALGSWHIVRRNCEENFTQTEEFAGSLIDRRMYQIIRSATRSFLQRRRALFDLRVNEGRIRDCHGDLRTDHIYYTEDGIQIIDCIEFNQQFRCSDIASDLAFLAMDLDFKEYPNTARTLLKAYIDHSGDRDVMMLMDFYKCYRAFVRAKVNCLRLKQKGLDNRDRGQLLGAVRRFVDIAYQYARQFSRPTLWVVCGMIASGKSTVAKALAEALQCRVLRSDLVRKQLFERRALDFKEVAFGEDIYSKEATSLTYGKLLLQAQKEIERGNSIILDATFSRRQQRREVLRLAADMDANTIFVECRCRLEIIKQRLTERDALTQVSDARLDHLDAFKSWYEALDEISNEIFVSVDTERPLNENVAKILSRVDMHDISD